MADERQGSPQTITAHTKLDDGKVFAPLSGKESGDENFPVGSFLLAKKLRPHVACYYNFARLADDIADDSRLEPKEKTRRLDMLRDSVENTPGAQPVEVAQKLAQSMAETNVDTRHASDLLKAFTQDSLGTKYRTWGDLIAYCRFSAAPVGRYLLDLHGEGLSTHWASDPLCAALQILNHIQDVREDLQELNRCYMPADIMADHNITQQDFLKDSGSANTRAFFNELLDGVDGLLIDGSTLPRITRSLGLRMEVCVILALAKKLARRLRENDPLGATKVELQKTDWITAGLAGVLKGFLTLRRTTENEHRRTG